MEKKAAISIIAYIALGAGLVFAANLSANADATPYTHPSHSVTAQP